MNHNELYRSSDLCTTVHYIPSLIFFFIFTSIPIGDHGSNASVWAQKATLNDTVSGKASSRSSNQPSNQSSNQPIKPLSKSSSKSSNKSKGISSSKSKDISATISSHKSQLSECFRQSMELKNPMCKSNSSQNQTVISPKGSLNILGTPLQSCCTQPMTGFERDGFCHTGPYDRGVHVVCAQMTDTFLAYTKAQGNDLSTASPQYGFPGLKAGDWWCLCVSRWLQAHRAGVAPPIHLPSTEVKALKYAPLELYQKYAISKTTSDE